MQSAGGGLYTAGGVLIVDNSTIAYNSAIYGGGIFSEFDGRTEINGSTISHNRALTYGGAIYNVSSLVTLENSTVTENLTESSSGGGAGIGNLGAVFAAFGSILEGRTVTVLTNTIVSANKLFSSAIVFEDLASAVLDQAEIESGAYNTFQSGGGNLIGATTVYSNGPATTLSLTTFVEIGDQVGITNPVLGELGDNGGATWTHRPLSGSPAIDVGSGCGPADQRGVARPQDGDEDGTALCDSGAVEYVPLNWSLSVDSFDTAYIGYNNPYGFYTLFFNNQPYAGHFAVDTSGAYSQTDVVSLPHYWSVRLPSGEPVKEAGAFTFDLIPGD